MSLLKQKILALALVALVITLFSQSTLAYYTVIGKATNVVTSGDIQLKIHEKQADGTSFPENGVEVIPGETVSKIVTIENVCSHPFYLRVKIVKGTDSTTLSADQVLQITETNEEQWHLHTDGYYYYYRILQPGETTEPLFEEVTISGPLVDQHDVTTALTLTVKAYAVQSENNPAANPWDAAGWPQD